LSEIGAGSGTGYPSALDSNNILEYDKESAEKTLVRSDVVNDIAAAIVAIQTALGTNPEGNAGDVSERIAFLMSSATSFTSGDTTPSVSGAAVFSVPAAVTITDFDDAPSTGTKLIEVTAAADGVVIEHDATKIMLAGGLNVRLNTDDTMIFRYDGTKWVERYRMLL